MSLPLYHPPLSLKIRSVAALAENRLRRRPLTITLELTRRCNARCDYCNHWREQRQAEQELAEYVEVVERFQPFAVTVCGGEPFMRRDALEILSAVKRAEGWRYVAVITNGWFLTDDRCLRLAGTGIDQVNVSLNWPDARQDDDRRIPGLFERIARVVPRLRGLGLNVQMNSILMNDNLDEAVRIAELADGWGATVMFTLYSELPGDNDSHLFPRKRWPRLREVLGELTLRRNVLNARWYFDTIPSFVAGERIGGCTAGKDTLHISPGGMVRPCAELPPVAHFRDYDPRAAEPTPCTACFQACRGEVQAPIDGKRLAQLLSL